MREIPCKIHYIRAKKRDYIIIVGLEEQKIPRAIFADIKRDRNLLNAQRGKLYFSRDTVSLICDNGLEIDNLLTDFNGIAGLICKLLTVALEQDAPLHQLIRILRRSRTQVGLEAALVRVLRYYKSLMQNSEV